MKLTLQYTPHIWFISDFHLCHENIITLQNRPFENTHYMHKHMIEKWNGVVNENDIVFYLGDLFFKNPKKVDEIVNQLKGKIYFVLGNHDKKSRIEKLNRFELIEDYIELTIRDNGKKHTLILFHYPILNWNKKHYGTIHLHGHSHGGGMKTNPTYYQGNVLDVSCEVLDYIPLEFKEIFKKCHN